MLGAMSFFDRVGNLLKGVLRKPVQALEDKLERSKDESPRSIVDPDLSALDRAREGIREAEIQAEQGEKAPAPAEPAPRDPAKKTPRSMGPGE